MILSGTKIKDCVENGLIHIDPFSEENLKAASYTFCLGSTIRHLVENQTLRTDVKSQYAETILSEEGYILQPGEFILSFTKERLALNGKYACQLSTRGSCAQIGLNVLLGSTYAEPDTDGVLILEIVNSSQLPIMLFPDMPIVKGIFFPVDEI